MNTFTFIIDYLSVGSPSPDPKYLLIQPIISQDGIHRWTRVKEQITYPVINNEIQVPQREINMFQNWTHIKPINGKFIAPPNYQETLDLQKKNQNIAKANHEYHTSEIVRHQQAILEHQQAINLFKNWTHLTPPNYQETPDNKQLAQNYHTSEIVRHQQEILRHQQALELLKCKHRYILLPNE